MPGPTMKPQHLARIEVPPLFEIETNMLKTALVIVLKRYWMLAVFIFLVNVVLQYWRADHISWALVLLTPMVVVLAVLVVALPIELHKLRNTR